MIRDHKLLAQAEDKLKEAKMVAEDWRYGEVARLLCEAKDLNQQAKNWSILVLRVVSWVVTICIAIYFVVFPLIHPTLTSSELLLAYWFHYLVGVIIMLLVSWWNQIIK